MRATDRRRRVWILTGLALIVVLSACRVPVPPPQDHRSDLVVVSVGDPPADGSAAQTFSVSVSVINTELVPADPSVMRLFLSLDDQVSDTDAVVGEVSLGGLRAQFAPHKVTIDATVPTLVAPGAYHLLACADATNLVNEQNENNNCRASAGTIVFAPPPPPPPPPPGDDSSQDLIAQDLEAGLIDYPTSLVYRTWALFRDLQLPGRYSDLQSDGEDRALFAELDAVFASLSADVQAAIKPYLVPPNDPESAFGPAPAAAPATARDSALVVDAALPSSDARCEAPAGWIPTDWTPPGGAPDDGFRVWICAGSRTEADLLVRPVVNAASGLWEPMTRAEPNGMGKPVPDTVNSNAANFGNGKIDIWIIYTSDCLDRKCPLFNEEDPDGPFNLGAETTISSTCRAPGYPPKSCSGYITINAGLVCPDEAVCSNASLKGTLAHEFFHVLQDAHNAESWKREAFRVGSRVHLEKSWYSEASAVWAAWYYAEDPKAYERFVKAFQTNNRSLLEVGNQHEYGSWVWPLLMQRELGPSGVFTSWRDAESAADPRGLDDAVDRTLRFADHFRDLAVRNLNPSEYFAQDDEGLTDDLWQTFVNDFPEDTHVHDPKSVIGVGHQDLFVEVAALAAEYVEFDIEDAVREITIDVASLAHADSADIDVVGRVAPDEDGGPQTWRRVRGSGTRLTLCRDKPNENFDLIYVVLSNHGRARAPLGGPDADAVVKGAYTVEAKNTCDVPDHYDVTFSGFSAYGDTWSGTATFDVVGPASDCNPITPLGPGEVGYCYGLVDGAAQWRYTNSQTGAVSEVSVRLLPSTDLGAIHLRLQDPEPQYQYTYKAGILPNSGAHVMLDPEGNRRDADDWVLAWLGVPDESLGNPPDIGDGFRLTGSHRGCGQPGGELPDACQGWTWNFVPRWDAD